MGILLWFFCYDNICNHITCTYFFQGVGLVLAVLWIWVAICIMHGKVFISLDGYHTIFFSDTLNIQSSGSIVVNFSISNTITSCELYHVFVGLTLCVIVFRVSVISIWNWAKDSVAVLFQELFCQGPILFFFGCLRFLSILSTLDAF